MSKKYRIVHLMANDKFNKPFVDFLNKNFDPREHLVLCKNWYKQFPFPEGHNVVEVKTYKNMRFDAPNIEKVICHSLYDEERVRYLFKNQEILKEKAYWQIWGGDLYDAPRDPVNDFVRTNFKGYISAFDEEYARNKYNMEGKFYKARYFSPISGQTIKSTVQTVKAHEGINIQINNSADQSTLEALDFLAKFKDENIKVCTVLSYSQTQYNDEIMAKGKEIFKDKFYALLNYLSPEEYAKHLVQQDILILNQNRQQGAGNAHLALHFGIKVFIKKDISLSKTLKESEVIVYDTEDIENMNFEDFINSPHKEKNKEAICASFRKNTSVSQWENIFNA